VAISMNELATGLAIRHNQDIYIVVEHKHVKPGKGGAFVRAKLKNIKTDQVLEKTFKPVDKIEDVPLEERKIQFSYINGDFYVFMDLASYEEVSVSKAVLGDSIKFLQENAEVSGCFHNNNVIKISLPIFIQAKITHTEPGFKGDTSRAGNKPATIDTGTTVQVPLFVDIDDMVKIDTRTGTYVERVQK